MADENVTAKENSSDEPKSFSAEYVHELREEAKKHRLEKNQLAEQFAELKKKADEFDAITKKTLEEQGKYKELYEKAQSDIAKKSELETRLAAIEAGYSSELDGIKKGLTEDEVKLIDSLEGVKVEQRLTLARTLAGKKQKIENTESRGGQGSTASIDSIVAEYSKADGNKKMKMLFELEKSNPALYKQLIN